MKIAAAITLGLIGASSVEGCPVFRYRWAGSAGNKDICLTTTSQGLTTAPCDDSNHSQMMVLESTNVPNAFYTGSHTSDEFLVDMQRTYLNTFTISTQGQCVGAKGKLGPCPPTTRPKGKGKAFKRNAAPMMKSSWYVEPLLSVPFDTPGESHDGHDHSGDAAAVAMDSSHDGHDHANGSHEPAPTFSSWSGGAVARVDPVATMGMDSSHDGHDHANGSHEPAPTFSSWTSGWGSSSGGSMGIRTPSAATMVRPMGMDSSHDGHDHANGSHEPRDTSHDGHDHANGSHEPAPISRWGSSTAATTTPKCRFENGRFVCN